MSDSSSESRPQASLPSAHAVLVVGSARSGANDVARALELLGLRVPGTDRPGASSSTASESRWVTEFHERLLRRANVAPTDARPQAWLETGKLATDEDVRRELFGWFDTEVVASPAEVVISDARLVWFLDLWKAAGLRGGVDPSYAVVLRAPAEAIASTTRSGPGHASDASRASGWLNLALHSERATRGARRAFVSYADLLEDWTVPLYELGERLGLDSVHSASARDIRRVHDLVDSRSAGDGARSWSGLDVPEPLRRMVEATWEQLAALAGSSEEAPEIHASLDELRREYSQFYADAERVAHSTIVASRRRPARRDADDRAPAPGGTTPPAPRRRLLARRRAV